MSCNKKVGMVRTLISFRVYRSTLQQTNWDQLRLSLWAIPTISFRSSLFLSFSSFPSLLHSQTDTMPSSLSSSPSPDLHLQTLLASARPFLRGELEAVHPKLPSLISVLRSVGAGECWHKHGSFLEHLFDMYKILKLWKAQESVCLCGLFHSAYSNSYVNLAIFDPSTGRDTVRAHVGDAAEELIYLFCVVPRQPLIHDDLLFRYSDDELVEHLKASEVSVRNAKEGGVFNGDEAWRKKVNSLVPPGGVTVKHIKTGEDVLVSRRVVAIFPGLWLNSISRMGAVYSLLVREEEIFIEERKRVGLDWAEKLLGRCVEKNPFVGEPHVVLAQIYLTNGRVLLMKAKERSWPNTSWGILNLGLVK
ncbi:unnamed protein product, partial [Vitis vinifera]